MLNRILHCAVLVKSARLFVKFVKSVNILFIVISAICAQIQFANYTHRIQLLESGVSRFSSRFT